MYGLNEGTQFHTENGEIAILMSMSEHNIVLETEETRAILSHKPAEFSQLVREQRYAPVIEPQPKPILTDYQEANMTRRLWYVKAVKYLVNHKGLSATAKHSYSAIIERVEKLHPRSMEKKHPSSSSISQWYKTWIEAQQDDYVLAGPRCEGRKILNPASEVVINQYLHKIMPKSVSQQTRGHYRAYKLFAEEEARKNPQVQVVSASTFSRRVNELNSIGAKLKSDVYSDTWKNDMLSTLEKSIRVNYALERVEVDRVEVNMAVLDDETKEPIGKIGIYVAIDCYTRYPLAVVVDFGMAENTRSVLNLLRNMFLSDNNLTATGKPDTIVMDNGPGFHNATIQKTCKSLKMNVLYTPVQDGSKKPFVESFFRGLRAQCFEGMLVQTSTGDESVGLNSYHVKPSNKNHVPSDKSIQERACLTRSDFLKILSRFMFEYVHTRHKKTNQTPHDRWCKSLDVRPAIPVDYQQIKHHFHQFQDKEHQVLQQGGDVTLLTQQFASAASKQLHSLLCLHKPGGVDVRVMYDPFDASSVSISAIDSTTNKQHDVVAFNRDHTFHEDEVISFNSARKKPASIYEIYQPEKLEPYGTYRVEISAFHKVKKKKRRNGKEVTSFEHNNELNLSTEERLNQANEQQQPVLTGRPTERLLEVDDSTDRDIGSKPSSHKRKKAKTAPDGEELIWDNDED